jgi:surface protein
MFYGATRFNQPLNVWVVSEVTNMSNMFNGATSFNQPLNMWVVSSVINMTGMFQNATSFNQPLNNWNVGEVQFMGKSGVVNSKTVNYGMFAGAISFNQPLNNWNVGKVTNMNGMFENATSFNQPLHNWNLKNDVNCFNMLDYCGMSQYNYQITLIGWYNTCVAPEIDIAPSKIGAAGMIYNKNINYGVSDNTATDANTANIVTTYSWKLQADREPTSYINFIRRAREYFGAKIEGDIEVNF